MLSHDTHFITIAKPTYHSNLLLGKRLESFLKISQNTPGRKVEDLEQSFSTSYMLCIVSHSVRESEFPPERNKKYTEMCFSEKHVANSVIILYFLVLDLMILNSPFQDDNIYHLA